MDELKPCPYSDGEVARKLRTFKDHCQIPGLDELILWAADIIDRRPAPENKPLTLEELRKMQGQPVYCIGQTRFDVHFDGWKVVTKNNSMVNVIRFTDGTDFPVDVYGKRLLAYAHKPEQETTT